MRTRWLTAQDHFWDNIENGWLSTPREVRFAAPQSSAILAGLVGSEPRIGRDGETVRLFWSGVSLTASDGDAFQSSEIGIFGRWGVQMRAEWLARTVSVVVAYVGDTDGELAALRRAASVLDADARYLALLALAPLKLAGEAEIRVISDGRVAFSCRDIETVFVPSEEHVEPTRRLLLSWAGPEPRGAMPDVRALPAEPTLPDFPSEHWDFGSEPEGEPG